MWRVQAVCMSRDTFETWCVVRYSLFMTCVGVILMPLELLPLFTVCVLWGDILNVRGMLRDPWYVCKLLGAQMSLPLKVSCVLVRFGIIIFLIGDRPSRSFWLGYLFYLIALVWFSSGDNVWSRCLKGIQKKIGQEYRLHSLLSFFGIQIWAFNTEKMKNCS